MQTAALSEAQDALEMLRVESEARESDLRQQHATQLQRLNSAHRDEVLQLQVEHAAAVDSQREAFEARLLAGREEFATRLSSMEVEFEQERDTLQSQLEAQQDEALKAELKWQAQQKLSLCKAHETSECQQRRLSAAFKSARCLATKEAELRAAYDDLARRFAARESRQEDLRCIAQQKASLAEQKSLLHDFEQRNESLNRELRNRDASDRIFGKSSGELRRGRAGSASPGPAGSGSSPGLHEKMPPLPGKKLNEFAQPFEARRRRQVPAASCRALSADPAPFDLPLFIR